MKEHASVRYSAIMLTLYVFSVIAFSRIDSLYWIANITGYSLAFIFALESMINHRGIFILPKPLVIFLVFVGFCLLSVLWSQNPEVTIGITLIQLFVLNFIIINILGRTGNIRPVSIGLLAGLGYAIYNVWMKVGAEFFSSNLSRYGSVTVNPNIYAFALLSGIVLLGFYYLNEHTISTKINAIIIISILLFSQQIIFVTGSRKGIILLFIVLGLILFFKIKLIIKQWKKAYYFLGGFFLLYVLCYLLQGTRHFQRILNVQLVFAGEKISETSIVYRSCMIIEALNMFSEKPLLGWGLDQFRYVSSFGTYSHSNYAELLANYGIIGFLLYYSIFLYLIFLFISKINNKHFSLISSWGIIVLLFLLIWDIAAVSYYDKMNWILISALIGLIQYNKKNEHS